MLLGSIDKGFIQFPTFDALKSQLPTGPVDVQVCSDIYSKSADLYFDFQPAAKDIADLITNPNYNIISVIFISKDVFVFLFISVQMFSYKTNPMAAESNFSISGSVCSLSLSDKSSNIKLTNLSSLIEVSPGDLFILIIHITLQASCSEKGHMHFTEDDVI